MAEQPDLIISTKALTKNYGQKRVVDGLNLAVPRGSICGFLGSNGAGKSTTIKLLLGLLVQRISDQVVILKRGRLVAQA